MAGSDAPGKWSVQVYGKNVLQGPMFETTEAEKVVVRGASGAPAVGIVKVADGRYMVCTRGDPDWVVFCERFGIS